MLNFFKETLPRVSSIQKFKNLLETNYYCKETHIYNPLSESIGIKSLGIGVESMETEDNTITEVEALFISKIILDELGDYFKTNPKKLSHDFLEHVWKDSDSDSDSDHSEKEKDIWRLKISKIITEKVQDYDTYEDKHSEIALCKWASKFIMTEYVNDITKRSLFLFVDEIKVETKNSKKLLNILNIIKLKLGLYTYKKFSKDMCGFSIIDEIPECSVVELIKIIDDLFNKDNLLFRPNFLISSETNPIIFSKMTVVNRPLSSIEEKCCCFYYNYFTELRCH